jgi:hypothetical protein
MAKDKNTSYALLIVPYQTQLPPSLSYSTHLQTIGQIPAATAQRFAD